MARDLHVSWDDYDHLIETLARRIHDSGWPFDQIVCIARGGMRVGDVLSRIFDLPLAILATRSYVEEGGTVRGTLTIAEEMTMTVPRMGRRILLVDDMVDSGATLAAVVKALRQRYPDIDDYRTAVLWWKACSIFAPDYYVDYLADNPWIHQPFEKYDRLSPAELPR